MRLCELYKASSEDAQAKALTKATEELQRLLRDASSRYGELETESNAKIESLKQQMAQVNLANEELRKELERANTLMDTSKSRLLSEDAVEAMSPSAAAASRLAHTKYFILFRAKSSTHKMFILSRAKLIHISLITLQASEIWNDFDADLQPVHFCF